MTDKDRTVITSPNGAHRLPDQIEAFDEFSAVEERPTALPVGLVSLGFIKGAIRRSLRFWSVLAIIGLIVGVGIEAKFPPAYKASTSVLITYGPGEDATSGVLDNQAIAQSRTVAQLAVRKLGIQANASSFAAATTVAVVTDRVLLITVSAPSSSQAVSRANAVAVAFLQFRADQLESAQKLLLSSLNQEVSQAKQQVSSLNSQISQLSAGPASRTQQDELKSLRTQLGQANSQLGTYQQAVQNTKAGTGTISAVKGSVVLDPAAPLAHSKFKNLLIYGLSGLAAGLALGLAIVVVRAIVSDRLRRRDDVANALGVPVKLSVAASRRSRSRPRRRELGADADPDVRRIVAHLRGAVPARRRNAALAVVPVDDSGIAAVSLVSLAVSFAQEGRRVLVVDLAEGAPAAMLLDSQAPGVGPVRAGDAHLTLAVPDRDDIAPAGPVGHAPAGAQRSAFTEAVASAFASADLLLTLATLDPSVGGEHLATWATDAVILVTAGRSSWERIHSVGEMIRLGGTSLTSAVLVGADRDDESLGVPDYANALTGISDLG